MNNKVTLITPGQFDPSHSFYPKALNAQIHPLVSFFLSLSREQIIARYIHMNPSISSELLTSLLMQPMKHFYWGGADLFCVTTASGNRKMIVLETNSQYTFFLRSLTAT